MNVANPAQLYLAGLSKGSQGMRQSLDIIARILQKICEDEEPDPRWEALRALKEK